MTEYRVRWEIDVEGTNPLNAATTAREHQTVLNSSAVVFQVRPKDDPLEARWDLVDLDDTDHPGVQWEYNHKALFEMAMKMVDDGGGVDEVLEMLEKPWKWPELLSAATLDRAFDAVSPGEDVPDVSLEDGPDDDLPPGYRWARDEDETVRADAILVPRTMDSTGKPYTQDEADIAVPENPCQWCDAALIVDDKGAMATGYWMDAKTFSGTCESSPSGMHGLPA
jgi:hypothetical protein